MSVKQVLCYGVVLIHGEKANAAIAKRREFLENGVLPRLEESTRTLTLNEDEYLLSISTGFSWQQLGDAVAELERDGLERGVHFFATGRGFDDEDLPPGVTVEEGEKPWERVYSYSPPA